MKDRISKLIALGAASEVQMDELGFDRVVVAKSVGPQVVTYAHDVERRGERFRFLLSNQRPDRRGDIVKQAGLDTVNYRKNNVVLLNHGGDHFPESLPLGTAELEIDGEQTWMHVLYDDANPITPVVRAMTVSGTLKAASISILPRKVDAVREKDRREAMGLGKYGVVYETAEVLEGSVVTLPMNADAVRNSVKVGVEQGLWTPDQAEMFVRVMAPTERDLMKRCGLADPEPVLIGNTPPQEHALYTNTLGTYANGAVTWNVQDLREPAWVSRLEKSMTDAAARMERAAASIHVKQAAVSGADGARLVAAESPAPGTPRRNSLSLILNGLEAREREGK